jgi:hypothetical protein
LFRTVLNFVVFARTHARQVTMTKDTTEHFDQGNYGIDPRDLDTPDNWVSVFFPNPPCLHAETPCL